MSARTRAEARARALLGSTTADDPLAAWLVANRTMTREQQADALGVSVSMIKRWRQEHAAASAWTRSAWTAAEDAVLASHPDRTAAELTTLLPGRNVESIRHRRRAIGAEITVAPARHGGRAAKPAGPTYAPPRCSRDLAAALRGGRVPAVLMQAERLRLLKLRYVAVTRKRRDAHARS